MNSESRKVHYLEYLYCLLLLVFFLGRIGFILYNKSLEPVTFGEAFEACKTGFVAHDLAVTAFLLALPWLLGLLALRFPQLPLRKLLIPYYIIVGIFVGLVIVADTVMYEFWQFKVCAVMLSYAASPEGATNSVSIGFLLSRILSGVGLMLLIIIPSILLTPKRMPVGMGVRFWMRNISIIWTFLLVAGLLFVRVGEAYYSPRIFLNHAATNPLLAFVSSFPHTNREEQRFDYFSEAERASLFEGLYPSSTEDVTDTLLRTQRPDVLFVFMESFGGKFVKELGGISDVAPQLSRLIPEGIFWDEYYSNSFRTDRGTCSAYGGIVAYPDVCLMKETSFHASLPSLAKSLSAKGYETSYLYAGPMTNMGKRDYLDHMGFQSLLDHTSFSPEEVTGSWGVDDDLAARKTCELVAQKDSAQRWFMAWQTISSHEPWKVPYQRLEDEKLNAFAYTDECVGHLIDSLKTLPQWDNLLVVILPDHGFLYEQNYQDPEFFHSPMLWLGGAIKEPRRMSVLMNQSDLCATLLSQMGISHEEYRWSRNVLSRNYIYPFVYSNFPAGLLFRDHTGVSLYDLTADEPILEEPSDEEGLRILRAKSILQTSYDYLGEIQQSR